MDYENERVLKLIFQNGVPDNLQSNVDLVEYLCKLGLSTVDQLKKEESRLTDENKSIVELTQDLAITNYKTFIQTAECSRQIFTEFKATEKSIDSLIDKFPDLIAKCEQFSSQSREINASRRLNSLTLKRNAQLLELLELPQLMNSCIREAKYEEALELSAYVQKMGTRHSNIPVIKTIVAAVESSWHTMLAQLLSQLSTDLQLPQCLQVIGYLRRMQAFSPLELKLKFLESRDSWFNKLLATIPTDDPQQHLTRTIELTRINLFNIITQYRAIFPDFEDDQSQLLAQDASINCCNRMFYSWLHMKIEQFLATLETDLERGITSMDTMLHQCMYFGLSFGRVGADFRGLMAPIFLRVITDTFVGAVRQATRQFATDIESYTLIDKSNAGPKRQKVDMTNQDTCPPPETLLDFHPLGVYCNCLLEAFNELRLCCPIACVKAAQDVVQNSLEQVARHIVAFYRQEQQALSPIEREHFASFCTCFAYDLIPYLQRCLHILFPVGQLSTALGIGLVALQKEGLSYLQTKTILQPLEHLLPDRVDAIMLQVVEQSKVEEETKKSIESAAEKASSTTDATEAEQVLVEVN